jgi:ketosteroid isomerase-like protein
MHTATIVAMGACVLAAAPMSVRAQMTPADSIAVGEAVRHFHDALAQGDSAAVLALLAEDAVILEAGGIESRAEYREHHLSADIQFARAVPAKAGPMRVVVAGDVAWVTSASEVAGTVEGRAIDSLGAELMVLTRGATGWRIRAIHWSSRRRATP